jgi:hypothetical protein
MMEAANARTTARQSRVIAVRAAILASTAKKSAVGILLAAAGVVATGKAYAQTASRAMPGGFARSALLAHLATSAAAFVTI